MSDTTAVLIKFKKLIVAFCDELTSQFPSEPDFKMMKVLTNAPGMEKFLMQKLITQLSREDLNIRKLVSERDEEYFLSHNPFSFLSEERNQKLVGLWKKGDMDDEDKDALWQWVDLFFKIADKYQSIE